MIMCAKLGMQYTAIGPKELQPDEKLFKQVQELAKENRTNFV